MGFLGSIGNVISGIAKFAIPIAEDLFTGGVGGLAKDIFSQLSQSMFQSGSNSTGGAQNTLFSNNVNLFGQNLPNPASALNGLLSGANGAVSSFAGSPLGQILQQIVSMLSGNQTVSSLPGGGPGVTVPTLGNRLGVMQQQASTIGNQIQQYVPQTQSSAQASTAGYQQYVPTISTGGGNSAVDNAIAGGAFSTAPTATEQKMLDGITDPSQKAQMQLQLEIQKQAQIASMVSNILNILHTTSMSIVGNMRA